MEKIVEYSVDEKVSYTWTLTTLENGKSPVKFKDIEKLKYDCVIGIIFWRSERIFDLDGRMCDGQDEIEINTSANNTTIMIYLKMQCSKILIHFWLKNR